MSKIGQRLGAIRENYRLTKEQDRRIGWILLAITVIGVAASVALGLATGNVATWLLIGLPITLLVLTIVFSRRAMRAAYRSIEGRPGAAVAVVQNMSRAGWGVTGAVAANKSQDLVHRAVGRPGVVLIAEGSSPALPSLVTAERRRTARFIGEIPIHEITIGDGPDRVPIAKLDKHLRKMNRVLAPGEVTDLRRRLEALGSAPLPMPKGPMPKSGRIPRGGKLR